MNCPKCGREAVSDQKFCRSCGATLQIITQPLVDSETASRLETTPPIIVRNGSQRANRTMLWGFIIMFIGVAIGVIGKMLIEENVVTVVGVLVSLVGMFLTVYPYLAGSPGRKYDVVTTAKPDELRQAQPTRRLPQESNIEYVPSVTERTTDLLKNSSPTKEDKKEESQV